VKIVDFSTADGDPVGSVTVTDAGELQPDLLLRSVAQSWQDKGRSPAEFATHYDGWSNGYMSARTRDEQENTSMATTPKLGSGARFKRLTAQLAGKGAKDPKALAASIGRKKYGPKKFGRLAAAKAKSKGSE